MTWHYGFEAVGVSAPHDFVPDRNVRMLGRWIERQVDVRCGGLHVERAGERQRAALWRILSVDD